MMSFQDRLDFDARLVILETLYKQPDGRLNDRLIAARLDALGHLGSTDWLRTQLEKLRELGAVTIVEVENFMIAGIRQPGRDHVERRSFLAGIRRPTPGE